MSQSCTHAAAIQYVTSSVDWKILTALGRFPSIHKHLATAVNKDTSEVMSTYRECEGWWLPSCCNSVVRWTLVHGLSQECFWWLSAFRFPLFCHTIARKLRKDVIMLPLYVVVSVIPLLHNQFVVQQEKRAVSYGVSSHSLCTTYLHTFLDTTSMEMCAVSPVLVICASLWNLSAQLVHLDFSCCRFVNAMPHRHA